MGTEYEILKSGTKVLSLYERSDKFSLSVSDSEEDFDTYVRDLTPTDLVTMALNMLIVASYFTPQLEFKEIIKNYVISKGIFSYEADILKEVTEAVLEK